MSPLTDKSGLAALDRVNENFLRRFAYFLRNFSLSRQPDLLREPLVTRLDGRAAGQRPAQPNGRRRPAQCSAGAVNAYFPSLRSTSPDAVSTARRGQGESTLTETVSALARALHRAEYGHARLMECLR